MGFVTQFGSIAALAERPNERIRSEKRVASGVDRNNGGEFGAHL